MKVLETRFGTSVFLRLHVTLPVAGARKKKFEVRTVVLTTSSLKPCASRATMTTLRAELDEAQRFLDPAWSSGK